MRGGLLAGVLGACVGLRAVAAAAQTGAPVAEATVPVEFRAPGGSVPVDEPVPSALREPGFRRWPPRPSPFRCWTPCTLHLAPGVAHLIVDDRPATVLVPPGGESYLVPPVPRARMRLAIGALVSGSVSVLAGVAMVTQIGGPAFDRVGWSLAGTGLVAAVIGVVLYEIEVRREIPLMAATPEGDSRVWIGEASQE